MQLTSLRRATNTWNYLRQKNALLHRNLKLTEMHKLEKTIPRGTSPPPINSPGTLQASVRRYRKLRRLRRKRLRFRRKRKEIKAASNYKAQQLNPINLSDTNINEHQISVLRKGPSFCPSPKDVNWQLVHDDLEAFEARLRTSVFFLEKTDEPEEDQEKPHHLPPVPGNKNWRPPLSKYPELELFLSNIRKDVLNPNIKLTKDNLSERERTALRKLKNSTTVVRIQDKGSRFVLLSSADYEEKMFSQLNNEVHYNQLQLDPTPKHISVVERWCSKWLQKGEITPEVANWVNNQKAKPGVAFGNVKTHKEGNPLRLITSCCGTPIENLSAFTEFYLQPLARKLPSFIKDTTDLLNRIELINNSGPFPEGTLLVSWDVVSMFPNIDNNLGLTAVKNALNARERLMPSTKCILEAVEICLKHNHSVFQHSFFLQIHGTAMGPKNACSYADLAMGEIDHKAKFCGPIKPAL